VALAQAKPLTGDEHEAADTAARAPLIAHLLTLAAAAVLIALLNLHSWFWGDEWDLIRRSLHPSARLLFEPHNGHWSTIPLLLWMPLISTVGLHSYWPYLLPLILAHLALAHVIWRVMIRSGQNPWLTTGFVAAFAVLGVGATNVNSALQVSFVGSVLFGYLAMQVADRSEQSRRQYALCWLYLIIAVMSSSIGVVMTVAASIVALLRRGWRAGAVTAAVPLVVFGVWYALIGHTGGGLNSPRHHFVDRMPAFVVRGLLNAFARPLNLPSYRWGAVPLVAVVLYLVVRAIRRGMSDAAIAYAGMVGNLVLFIVVASGRAQMPQLAFAERYAYESVALYLPAAALATSALLRRLRQPVAVSVALGAILCAALVAQEVSLLVKSTNRHVKMDEESRRLTLAAAVVARQDPWLSGQRPLPEYPDLKMSVVRTLEARGALPSLAGVKPVDILSIRSVVEVRPAAARIQPHGLAPVIGSFGAHIVASQPGCVDLTPTSSRPQMIIETLPKETDIAVSTRVSGRTALTLRAAPMNIDPPPGGTRAPASAPMVEAYPRSVKIVPGELVTWRIVVPKATAVLGLPTGGASRVCGVIVR
jgi:hypothetical protein